MATQDTIVDRNPAVDDLERLELKTRALSNRLRKFSLGTQRSAIEGEDEKKLIDELLKRLHSSDVSPVEGWRASWRVSPDEKLTGVRECIQILRSRLERVLDRFPVVTVEDCACIGTCANVLHRERHSVSPEPHANDRGLPNPVANESLARLAGVQSETVSKAMKRALQKEPRPVKKVLAGKPRYWTHDDLLSALPHLTCMQLVDFLESVGFTNRI